jgi:hypothetical protein
MSKNILIARPFVRIGLRYISGVLIAKGVLDSQTGLALGTDPEILDAALAVIGGLIGVVSELAYKLAKKSGGNT